MIGTGMGSQCVRGWQLVVPPSETEDADCLTLLKVSRFESPDTEHGFPPSLITDIGGGFDCSPTQVRHLDYITAEMFAIPWGIQSRATELTSTAHCPPNSGASAESTCC